MQSIFNTVFTLTVFSFFCFCLPAEATPVSEQTTAENFDYENIYCCALDRIKNWNNEICYAICDLADYCYCPQYKYNCELDYEDPKMKDEDYIVEVDETPVIKEKL